LIAFAAVGALAAFVLFRGVRVTAPDTETATASA
jgi:hypothetical protein